MNSSSHVQSPLMNQPGAGGARRSWLWPLLSLLIGALFIYAGVVKVFEPLRFATDIQNYRVLSYPLAVRMAFYLPWLEMLCGLALILGWLRAGAVAILSGLMVIFIGVTIAAKARGINIDCGCFGGASKGLSFTAHLLIDLAVLGGLVAIAVFTRPTTTTQG